MSEVKIPPIKIQGIKTKLIPFIQENLPDLSNKTWYEPFLGSGVVGFNLAPENAVFGDNNPYTIRFYQDIQEGKITPQIVKNYLKKEGKKLQENDTEYFYEVRKRFNQNHESLDFLFLNRCDFNGMIRFNRNGEFNVPFGHNKNRFSDNYIEKIVDMIKWVQDKTQKYNWKFVHTDCFDFLKNCAGKDSKAFIYLDPPYIGRNTDYYDSWNIENEKKLQKILEEIEKPFLLSTWSHDLYCDSKDVSLNNNKNLFIGKKNECLDTIWKEYDKITTEHKYFIAANAEKRGTVIEALLKGMY